MAKTYPAISSTTYLAGFFGMSVAQAYGWSTWSSQAIASYTLPGRTYDVHDEWLMFVIGSPNTIVPHLKRMKGWIEVKEGTACVHVRRPSTGDNVMRAARAVKGVASTAYGMTKLPFKGVLGAIHTAKHPVHLMHGAGALTGGDIAAAAMAPFNAMSKKVDAEQDKYLTAVVVSSSVASVNIVQGTASDRFDLVGKSYFNSRFSTETLADLLVKDHAMPAK